MLESLDHPNIVKYLGFLKTDSMLNIVLEFVENGSLLTLLKQFGTMGEKLVVNYAARMLDGLSYLHEKGVVHCDLKAANILTTKNGEVKLTDFGVSKQLNVLDKSTSAVGMFFLSFFYKFSCFNSNSQMILNYDLPKLYK